MSNKLVIIGASGHGKVVADIARKNGYEEIVFLDDNDAIQKCSGYPVIGKCADAQKIEADMIVAIGHAGIRKQMMEALNQKRIVTLIHPDAVIADGVEIGKGTVVMAGTVINPGAVIGKGCIINTCSSVDHDCRIGDYVHVAVGSHIAGGVSIGEQTWIGAGATVSNQIEITSQCMIGAGAVVVKNIEVSGTYAGVPARRMEKRIDT
jgi:sugar O-acyltransferase (sialic acid O-acetyltransferase NeuD family)